MLDTQAKSFVLVRWLAVAGTIEWFLGRTLIRAAIHIPKSDLLISLYTLINQLSQWAAVFVALLAVGVLGWMGWRAGRLGKNWGLLGVGMALIGLTVWFLLQPPPSWLALLYQLLALAVIGLLAGQVYHKKDGWLGLGFGVPAFALIAGLIYQALPNLYHLLHWAGPPLGMGLSFQLGEIAVLGSVGVWWWIAGRQATWPHWLGAALPAGLFGVSFVKDAAMTGILTIWSTGLTLFLPWALYLLALWLLGVTILTNWHKQPALACALLLLLSAGYTPQLSSQLFCGLIALGLLVDVQPPLPVSRPVFQDDHALLKRTT